MAATTAAANLHPQRPCCSRQMRDANGLKPKDRPAMYVKSKVPEFERNVAQVGCNVGEQVYSQRTSVLCWFVNYANDVWRCYLQVLDTASCCQTPEASAFCPLAGSRSNPLHIHMNVSHVLFPASVLIPVGAAFALSVPLANSTCTSKVITVLFLSLHPSSYSLPAFINPLPSHAHPCFSGLVDVDGELKRLEKQVRCRSSVTCSYFGFVFTVACESVRHVTSGWARSRLARRAAEENGSCRFRVQGSCPRANRKF